MRTRCNAADRARPRTTIWTRLGAVIATLALAFMLTVSAALATESDVHEESGQDSGEDSGKVQLPEDPRDLVGLGLLGLTVLAVGLGLDNARRQLRGEREQTDGVWRYR